MPDATPAIIRRRTRLRMRRERAAGVVLALAVETLLVLVFLWWLAPFEEKRREVAMTTFDVAAPPPAEADAESAPATPEPAEPADPEPPSEPPPPVPPPPVARRPAPPSEIQPPPAIVPLTREQMASADITRIAPPAAAAPRRTYGPPAPPRAASSDSEVVGTAPNGQPLYAARWYREPYPEELRGYLSTATRPGWGMIACRMVPDFRVEDCEGLEEYPRGSNYVRSILAAAWQFKVRPPTIGGRPQYGTWVRIRITDTDLPR